MSGRSRRPARGPARERGPNLARSARSEPRPFAERPRTGYLDASGLVLPPSLADSLAAGHPWVYRDHVPPGVDLPSGAWVPVRAGKFSGFALWDTSSAIALRVFSRERAPDAAWFRGRVREALSLRAELRTRDTTAFRLLYGEGDGVPGVTLDVYGSYGMVVTYADSLDTVLPHVVDAAARELALDGVVRKIRRPESGEERLSLLQGRMPPSRLLVKENGMTLLAELEAGQKTGLFLDHRDNREWVRRHAAERHVLNLFAYTGAFSLAAALGGARRVTSVDIAEGAIRAARENFALNGLEAEGHEFVTSDVFAELDARRQAGQRFDLVISDPPSFATSRDKLFAALRAYTRLHASGLRVVREGGIYAAASCTSQVSPDAFRQVLAQAAERARVRLQLFHEAAQPVDHPFFAGHPEGRYLKFVAGRVLGPV